MRGEWDLTNVAELRSALADGFDKARGVGVDTTETTFVDSSVLHALFRARQRVLGEEKALVIQLGSDALVRNALRVAGLLDSLPVARERGDALRLAIPGARRATPAS
jgi:anti-anti-sigma factor